MNAPAVVRARTVKADALARAHRRELVARVRRTEWVFQWLVVAGWFCAAALLTAVPALVFGYRNPFGIAAVVMAFAGLLAPLATSAQRAVKEAMRARRMRLVADWRSSAEHLSPRLRELAVETRIVLAAVDESEDPAAASRAVWEWMHGVEEVAAEDRRVLAGLGLSTQPMREVVFRGTGDEGRVRGDLTESQQVSLARHLQHFESVLTGTRAIPYR
jgi:hypothetical protein